MKLLLPLFTSLALFISTSARALDYAVYEGKSGPGVGKHIVFLSGDEEYRSEESLPQLAKILSTRHGFKCTVLFAINPTNHTINPEIKNNLPGAEALDSADVIVMLLRFREWPDEQMKHFVDAYLAGKPIIALRTSTHAFNFGKDSNSSYTKFTWNNKEWAGGFGKQVLGETWVAHHGAHKKEATRGIIEPSASSDPVLRGVEDIFANSDVYAANPSSDVKILIRGQVLSGMEPSSAPVEGKKNDPMQPIAWKRSYKNEAGKTNYILCTTMGAATDLANEGLRRLVVNAVYEGSGLLVPAKADVTIVGDYRPSMYGFGGYVRNVKPADLLTAAPHRTAHKAGEPLFKPNDHIALIGGTLADRFQHSGWLETFIYSKFPTYDLVFRNLALAGDEVVVRSRPENFGTPEDWLKKTKADVVFAFFGFNESFLGPAGLPQFRQDLDKFLKDTLSSNYSGKDTARVILFSPTAIENNPDPDLPDPSTNNANLQAYARAMEEVARANEVAFVNLFEISRQIYSESAEKKTPLTFNGLHLTDKGDEMLAAMISLKLFGEQPVEGKTSLFNRPASAQIEKLRQAVNDKNEEWHARYRTVDGYNVYGGRSALAYKPEKGGFISNTNAPEPYVSNFKVMQEEMSQRDVLTANRDKKVWATAKGGDYEVKDDNLPTVTKIKTNKPGPKPDESFDFLGGEAAIAKMTIPKGFKVNLFASEEQFPELIKPVQMAWDTKGRLWVCAWRNYPERAPDSKIGDSLLVFEDTNGDGKADKCTHFIDDLNAPTGFQFYKDGVLLVQAPDVWFLRDTNHDGRADTKERVLMGLSSADSHHTANSLCLDPVGAVYLSDGVFHRTQVETSTGPLRNNDAAIYRFEPRTGKFETYISYGFANPHGRAFDYWGNDIITDATGNNSYFGPAFSGHIDYPAKHPHMNEFWKRPSRPCAGTAILTSRNFPDDYQGNFLNCNVISFQGIYRVAVTDDGSGLKGETLDPLVSSTDPNFRPTAVNVGPDGAVYFADWQNPIIGHMQHHLRDPNRDHEHGRIYRIVCENRPLAKRPKIDGQSISSLLKLLKEPENQVREWAKVELGKHKTSEVIPAVRKWAASLDTKDPNYQHHLVEALWVQQWHNVVDNNLLERLLKSSSPRVRTAATRVLCYGRASVPDALARLKMLADDENPRVRLEAVRAASFFSSPEAVDVAFAALNHPLDYYLDYTLKETLRQLDPFLKNALQSKSSAAAKWSEPQYQAAREFVFGTLSTPELLALPRSPMVLEILLTRPDVSDSDRVTALAGLAEAKKTNMLAVLLSGLEVEGAFRAKPATDASSTKAIAIGSLSRLLPYQNPQLLKPVRPRLLTLASSPNAELSQNAWAALVLTDDGFDTVWGQASAAQSQANLLNGIPRITNQELRVRAFDRVSALINASSTSSEVLRAAINALVSMTDQQEATFKILTGLIDHRTEISTAARGIRIIPRAKWQKDQAAQAATALANWCKSVPDHARSDQQFTEAVQLAKDLSASLPPEQAAALRKDLQGLKISSFVIRTVREQMRYDTPRLVVEAGKPFEILFENADFMPHNLVVVAPNTREKVGMAAGIMKPEDLDKKKRSYVPNMPEILAATRLLQTGEHEKFKITAPETTGDYEYVCTFPGHYQVMWGSLVVTKDPDAYLAAHPEPVLPTRTDASLDGPPEHEHNHKH